MTAACLIAVALIRSDPPPTPIEATARWTGSVDNESLQTIAPPFLTTAEGFAILWKAWGGSGDVPGVDFRSQIVTVATTRGSILRVTHQLDRGANLKVLGLATLDLRPGFRYVLSAVPRDGVATVEGKPLPPAADLVPAMPTGKSYQPAAELTGKLHFVGSVTMSHLLYLWAEGFGKHHPKLEIDVNCEGSESALPDLKPNAVTILAKSRPVTEDDLKEWSDKLGRPVSAFPVCEDEIAVIVNAKNPVAELSPEQLKRIYAAGDLLTWGDLGAAGDIAGRPLVIHGRGDRSGTRRYLRRLAIGDGGVEREQKVYSCYTKLVEAVAADLGGIGYCRGVNVTAGVRAVAIGPVGPMRVMRPYIRRPCHLVVIGQAGEPMPPAVKEFLTFVYRIDGQSLLFRDGFHPVGKDVIDDQLDRIGVEEIK